MPSSGQGWEGGDAVPPPIGSDKNWWWMWNAMLSVGATCGHCASMHGSVSPKPRGPQHIFCACVETPVPRSCSYQGRTMISEDFEEYRTEIGMVPPHSTREFSDSDTVSGEVSGEIEGSGVGVGVGGGASSTSGQKTAISNQTDEPIPVFAVWRNWQREYLDAYECSGLTGSSTETYSVTQNEVEFYGFDTV